MKVKEIFYSIQGEGANAGMPAIFVRLSGCNLRCIFCDTDFQGGVEMSPEEILNEVKKYGCKNIIWTGGEPSLQLTDAVLSHFRGFYNAIETNGTSPLPTLIDYVTISPKGTKLQVTKCDEIRVPLKIGDTLPEIGRLPVAANYFLSPIDVSSENVNYCLIQIKANPKWKLSVQVHKLLKIQ
jgi:organic radical activating enzyme